MQLFVLQAGILLVLSDINRALKTIKCFWCWTSDSANPFTPRKDIYSCITKILQKNSRKWKTTKFVRTENVWNYCICLYCLDIVIRKRSRMSKSSKQRIIIHARNHATMLTGLYCDSSFDKQFTTRSFRLGVDSTFLVLKPKCHTVIAKTVITFNVIK